MLPALAQPNLFNCCTGGVQVLELHLGVFTRQDHTLRSSMEGSEHDSFGSGRRALGVSVCGCDMIRFRGLSETPVFFCAFGLLEKLLIQVTRLKTNKSEMTRDYCPREEFRSMIMDFRGSRFLSP